MKTVMKTFMVEKNRGILLTPQETPGQNTTVGDG
jgi:hypothetical protein